MTLHRDPFRVTATLLLGDAGSRPLPLSHALTTDHTQPPIVVEWLEFDQVQIGLESDNEEAVLELEGYDGQILAGLRRQVPGAREQDAYPWYPGDYELRVTIDGTVWFGLFRVKPRHLDVDQLAELRQDLERVVSGLSLDVSVGRGYMGQADPSGDMSGVDGVRLRQLGLLRQALSEVIPTMAQIEREPQRKLGRQYEVVSWHRSQRLDGKSFRWLARGEWLREPRSVPAGGWNQNPRAVLVPTANQSLDTYENRVVRFILDGFLSRTRALRNALFTDLQAVWRDLDQAERNRWDTRLLQERVAGYERLQPIVAEVEKRLGQLVDTHFLDEVGELSGRPIPTTTLLKDGRYRTLYRWYQRVEEALVTVDTGEQFQTRTKRTSTLYEYWCLFRVIELFGELGFHLTEGGLGMTLREANRERLIPVIEPGSLFWLDGPAGQRLRVVYDQALPPTQDDARAFGYDVYIANPKNRPDIRVDLMADGQPVRSLVLDAKYRRLSNIWNRGRPSEVVYQLLSYSTNLYHVARPRQPLTQVAVALYPGADGDPEWQTREAGGIALARMAPNRLVDELKRCFQRFVGDEIGA